MSAKYSFDLKSEERRRSLPNKIIIGQKENEGIKHVMLKFLAFVLFHRERVQIEPNLDLDAIPFAPGIVQLDYEMRVRLWVECGECTVAKLHKLAVKVPEAEIWVLKHSLFEAQNLFQAMAKGDLRRDRYGLIGLDPEMFDEMCKLLGTRNAFTWLTGEFDPPHLQFEFNGLWFDSAFTVLRF
jgi:uncharacterized protein YaeQ